ncbi:MAG: hypothetical protein CMN79_03500 [Spirochaetales bacterium]|jgi:hypothetical protein|nr:hypothetical protein [Spirochaetales bacterium]
MSDSLAFFKPNSKSTGHLCSFKYSKLDNSFMAELVKQSSWNAQTHQGSFAGKDPSKKVSVKLSETEIGQILACIKKNIDVCGGKAWYHASKNQITRIKFEPWFKMSNEGGTWVKSGGQLGYSFKVQKEDREDSSNKSNFQITLGYGESEALLSYLMAGLADFNSSRLEKYSKKQKEWINNSKKAKPAEPSSGDEFADIDSASPSKGDGSIEVEPW